MTMHTPTPWVISSKSWSRDNGAALDGITPVVRMHGACDAVIVSLGADQEEQNANACLIAAAPDLLAALEQVMKYLEDGVLVRDITQDAKPEWAMKMMYFVRDVQKWQMALAKAKGEWGCGSNSLETPR